jgi:metal-responsive CopG/Arc/MetJ family transcriptional regulator
MKTAISLPDELFASADDVAQRLGVSRSELYATAVAEYIAKFQSEQTTAQLNTVYAKATPPDPAMRSAARRTASRTEW